MAALLYLLGALVTAVAPNLPVMVIGRLVYGIGIGLVMNRMLFFFFPNAKLYLAPSMKLEMYKFSICSL